MRPLYTLAYPILAPEDRAFIDAFRELHDLPYRDVVAPHFTLVFASQDVPEAVFCAHVADIAKAFSPLPFACRYAMLGADHASPTAHVFLVPDEGRSALSLLHDQLYTGVLARHLRFDIPFAPHITIGTLDDRAIAKRLCDDLNRHGIQIVGRVDALTVAALEASKIRNIASFPLSLP